MKVEIIFVSLYYFEWKTSEKVQFEERAINKIKTSLTDKTNVFQTRNLNKTFYDTKNVWKKIAAKLQFYVFHINQSQLIKNVASLISSSFLLM
jgi:hypothetical protein